MTRSTRANGSFPQEKIPSGSTTGAARKASDTYLLTGDNGCAGRYDFNLTGDPGNAGLAVWFQETDSNSGLSAAKLRPGWVA